MRDTKLQKKLAREALVRKNAEVALRASVANGTVGDVLGLSSDLPAASTEDVRDTADGDAPIAISIEDRSPQPPVIPPQAVDGALSVEADMVAAPRGPRQRRGVRSAGIAVSGSSQGLVLNHSPPDGQVARIGTGEVQRVGAEAGNIAQRVGFDSEPAFEPMTVDTSSSSVHVPHSSATELAETGAPSRKRRRGRAQADPEAAAAREAHFRNTFN